MLALGHKGVLADALWLRALPDVAREFDDVERKERWLRDVVETVTSLDPTFHTPYDYGQNYLTLLDRRIRPGLPPSRRAQASVEVLERGAARLGELEELHGELRHERSSLLRALAMLHYMERKDRDAALELLDRCAERPDCDVMTLRMWSNMKARSGDELLVLDRWARMSEHANPEVAFLGRFNLEREKRSLAQRALARFRKEQGRDPDDLAELSASSRLGDDLAEVVFDGLELRDGHVASDAFDELNRESWRRAANHALSIRAQGDDEPGTLEWLADPKNPVGVGRPPEPQAGFAWDVEDGEVRLVPTGE